MRISDCVQQLRADFVATIRDFAAVPFDIARAHQVEQCGGGTRATFYLRAGPVRGHSSHYVEDLREGQ